MAYIEETWQFKGIPDREVATARLLVQELNKNQFVSVVSGMKRRRCCHQICIVMRNLMLLNIHP